MKDSSFKQSGWALLAGCLLMVVTMVLHPTGGNFKHILAIASMGIIAHSIAIASVPISLVGFWGLHQRLKQTPFLSRLGMAFMLLALIAAALAAAINGLALPLYVQRYAEATPELIEQLIPILRYGTALNHAFDFMLMGGVGVSMLIWSICFLQNTGIPRWIGYLGIILCAGLLGSFIFGFYLVDLQGFRLFIFGWVIWVVATGISLIRMQK